MGGVDCGNTHLGLWAYSGMAGDVGRLLFRNIGKDTKKRLKLNQRGLSLNQLGSGHSHPPPALSQESANFSKTGFEVWSLVQTHWFTGPGVPRGSSLRPNGATVGTPSIGQPKLCKGSLYNMRLCSTNPKQCFVPCLYDTVAFHIFSFW